jgi:hypothetical protein
MEKALHNVLPVYKIPAACANIMEGSGLTDSATGNRLRPSCAPPVEVGIRELARSSVGEFRRVVNPSVRLL